MLIPAEEDHIVADQRDSRHKVRQHLFQRFFRRCHDLHIKECPFRKGEAPSFVDLRQTHGLIGAVLDGKEEGIPLQAGLLPFLCRCLAYDTQGIVQLVLIDGLENIVIHAILHGLPGVLKVPEAGNDDTLGGRIFRGDALDQLDPRDLRHLNVTKQNIRRLVLKSLQHIKAVLINARKLQSQALPIDQVFDQVSDAYFVVDDHNFHGSADPLSALLRQYTPKEDRPQA